MNTITYKTLVKGRLVNRAVTQEEFNLLSKPVKPTNNAALAFYACSFEGFESRSVNKK